MGDLCYFKVSLGNFLLLLKTPILVIKMALYQNFYILQLHWPVS